jgi:hypothetical protein
MVSVVFVIVLSSYAEEKKSCDEARLSLNSVISFDNYSVASTVQETDTGLRVTRVAPCSYLMVRHSGEPLDRLNMRYSQTRVHGRKKGGTRT